MNYQLYDYQLYELLEFTLNHDLQLIKQNNFGRVVQVYIFNLK